MFGLYKYLALNFIAQKKEHAIKNSVHLPGEMMNET
jgi:hypothetical protein